MPNSWIDYFFAEYDWIIYWRSSKSLKDGGKHVKYWLCVLFKSAVYFSHHNSELAQRDMKYLISDSAFWWLKSSVCLTRLLLLLSESRYKFMKKNMFNLLISIHTCHLLVVKTSPKKFWVKYLIFNLHQNVNIFQLFMLQITRGETVDIVELFSPTQKHRSLYYGHKFLRIVI